MGLTFHYSARIQAVEQVTALTTEVADICQSLGWENRLWDQAIKVTAPVAALEPNSNLHSIHLKGISFTPPECEPIWLTFTPSGRLTSLVNLLASDAYEDPNWIYQAHTKTQYAGSDTHIAVITLLKYLDKKYLLKMEVEDEGYYWKSMDKAVLEQRFKDYWSLIEMVKNALEGVNFSPTADAMTIATQIEAILLKRLGGGMEENKSE